MESQIERLQRINRERREAGIVTETTHNLVKRAKRHPGRWKLAINAMCFQCFGGTEENLPDPGWREMIATCTATDCALWGWRPYKDGISGASDEE